MRATVGFSQMLQMRSPIIRASIIPMPVLRYFLMKMNSTATAIQKIPASPSRVMMGMATSRIGHHRFAAIQSRIGRSKLTASASSSARIGSIMEKSSLFYTFSFAFLSAANTQRCWITKLTMYSTVITTAYSRVRRPVAVSGMFSSA